MSHHWWILVSLRTSSTIKNISYLSPFSCKNYPKWGTYPFFLFNSFYWILPVKIILHLDLVYHRFPLFDIHRYDTLALFFLSNWLKILSRIKSKIPWLTSTEGLYGYFTFCTSFPWSVCLSLPCSLPQEFDSYQLHKLSTFVLWLLVGIASGRHGKGP